jgi:hypothetical protein
VSTWRMPIPVSLSLGWKWEVRYLFSICGYVVAVYLVELRQFGCLSVKLECYVCSEISRVSAHIAVRWLYCIYYPARKWLLGLWRIASLRESDILLTIEDNIAAIS